MLNLTQFEFHKLMPPVLQVKWLFFYLPVKTVIGHVPLYEMVIDQDRAHDKE